MKNKKIQALIASLIINLCVGSIYAWSVFEGPLVEAYGWSPQATAFKVTDMGMYSMAFMIAAVMAAAGIVIAALLQRKETK